MFVYNALYIISTINNNPVCTILIKLIFICIRFFFFYYIAFLHQPTFFSKKYNKIHPFSHLNRKKRPYPWHPPRTQTFHPFPISNSHTLTQSRVISFSEATPHIAIVSFNSLPILLT